MVLHISNRRLGGHNVLPLQAVCSYHISHHPSMTDPDPAICHSCCSHAAAGLETVFWEEYMGLVGLVLAVAIVL